MNSYRKYIRHEYCTHKCMVNVNTIQLVNFANSFKRNRYYSEYITGVLKNCIYKDENKSLIMDILYFFGGKMNLNIKIRDILFEEYLVNKNLDDILYLIILNFLYHNSDYNILIRHTPSSDIMITNIHRDHKYYYLDIYEYLKNLYHVNKHHNYFYYLSYLVDNCIKNCKIDLKLMKLLNKIGANLFYIRNLNIIDKEAFVTLLTNESYYEISIGNKFEDIYKEYKKNRTIWSPEYHKYFRKKNRKNILVILLCMKLYRNYIPKSLQIIIIKLYMKVLPSRSYGKLIIM